MNKNPLAGIGLVLATVAPTLVHAQVTLKPDGQWRSLFSAGASLARGNTSATSLSAGADIVRLTGDDKWALNANAQYGRSDAEQTTNRLAATGLHSRNFTPDWFGFGQVDLLRDTPANLSSRATLGGGVGYHLLKGEQHTWDLSAGLGYTWDRFVQPAEIDGAMRRRDQHADMLLAQESSHKFTESRFGRRARGVRCGPVGGHDRATGAHRHGVPPLRQPPGRRPGAQRHPLRHRRLVAI